MCPVDGEDVTQVSHPRGEAYYITCYWEHEYNRWEDRFTLECLSWKLAEKRRRKTCKHTGGFKFEPVKGRGYRGKKPGKVTVSV